MNTKNPFPMTKSIFNDISVLEVLNWVTVYSQTEKYVENISTLRNGEMKHAMENFGEGRIFFIGWWEFA